MAIDRRQLLAAGCVGAVALPLRAVPAPVWRNLLRGLDLRDWRYHEAGIDQPVPRDHVRLDADGLHLLGAASMPDRPAPYGYLSTDIGVGEQRFQLHAEYRWGRQRYAPRAFAKRNSGIVYRLSPDTQPSREAFVEFQIQESNVGDMVAVNLRAAQSPAPGGTPVWPIQPGAMTYPDAAVHEGIARRWFRGAGDFERRDDWNSVDIVMFDDSCAHLVNGRIVTAAGGLTALDGAAMMPRMIGGRIGLQLEAAEISFRNVRVRPIAHPLDIIL